MKSNIENKNKDFGELLANFLYENGMNYCPYILNSEQANALDKRYNDALKILERNGYFE